jgi:hypothetical protein
LPATVAMTTAINSLLMTEPANPDLISSMARALRQESCRIDDVEFRAFRVET